MTPELAAALTTVGVAALGAIGVLIRYIVVRLEAKIRENTVLTAQAKEAAENGHAVRESLIAERDQARAYLARSRDEAQRLLLERDAYLDMIRFANARADGRAILLDYAERRQQRTHDAALNALLTASVPAAPARPAPADEDIDDPTGTDGGAYPGGRRST